MRVNAPLTVNAPGRCFLTKTNKIRSKRPLTKEKMRQTPRYHSERHPIILGGKRPGAKLATNLSVVGDGAVSEANLRRALSPRKLNAWDVGRYVFCATTAKQIKSDAGTWAVVPSLLVGAASPGRRKLPQEFD